MNDLEKRIAELEQKVRQLELTTSIHHTYFDNIRELFERWFTINK